MIPLKDNIPSRTFPFVNYFIIAINAAVFFLQLKFNLQGAGEEFIRNYALVPKHFFANFPSEIYTIFSAMFMHAGFLHFFGNMLFLYIFGDNVEDRLGHFVYLIFYLFCGMISAGLQTFFSVSSTIPMLGASGAIGGVLGAYFLLYPKAKVSTLIIFIFFIQIIEIPAFFFLGLWFLFQMLSGTMSLASGPQNMGGVAFWAHIGGFLSGVFWVLVLYRRKRGR